jgi:hypothetical protein
MNEKRICKKGYLIFKSLKEACEYYKKNILKVK